MGLERYLCVGGIEVANPIRTLAYMTNLGNSCQPAPPSVACCQCPDWLPSIDADSGSLLDSTELLVPDSTDPHDSIGPESFTTPAADDAPWYDPAVPESADVLGVWIEEAALSSPYSRKANTALRGASLGPQRLGGRELHVVGWVYTRSEAATAYARQWLTEAMAGDDCDCNGTDLTVFLFCDPTRAGAGKRTLKRVGLTAINPDIDSTFPRRCGLKFDATLTAEVPELFHDPVEVLAIADVLDGSTEICNLCVSCLDTSSDCTCGPTVQAPRVVPQPDPDAVFCLPLVARRTVQALPSPDYWRDATTIITVTAGTWPGRGRGIRSERSGVKNLRLRAWPNPAELEDPSYFDCQDPCVDIEVGCIPEGGTLVIDGTTRRASMICGAVEQNAYAYLSSAGSQRFQWPDVSCDGLMLVLDADPYATPPGTSLTIEYVTRERG